MSKKFTFLFTEDNSLREGHTLVVNEIELLDALCSGLRSAPYQVLRISTAKEWAERFAEMALLHSELEESLTSRICNIFPTLSLDQADNLAKRTGLKGDSIVTYENLLVKIFGNPVDWATLCASESTAETKVAFANYLIWAAIDHPEIPNQIDETLLGDLLKRFVKQNDLKVDLLPIGSDKATHLLGAWLKLHDKVEPAWLNFIAPLPIDMNDMNSREKLLRCVRKSYKEQLKLLEQTPRSILQWFKDVRKLKPEKVVQDHAMHELADFLRSRTELLSQDLIKSVSGSIRRDIFDEWRRFLPPPQPAAMPTTVEGILRWATSEYLPYRQWQVRHGDDKANEIANTAASGFAHWLLSYIEGKPLSAFEPAHQLYYSQKLLNDKNRQGKVSLWAILDGLGWLDAIELLQKVRDSSRLRIELAEPIMPCLGLLPTITNHTKMPVRFGVAPSDLPSVTDRLDAGIRKPDEFVEHARHSKPGELLVFLGVEPDKTYHDSAAEHNANAISSQLSSIAELLARAVDAVPEDLEVSLHITTDHGRLIGSAQRLIPVPNGFESHGRALLQTSPISESPTPISGVAWLRPELNQLEGWAGISIGPDAFMKNSSKGSQLGGSEYAPHGGAYPEEIIVPWLTFERKPDAPDIEVKLSGKGVAGKSGIAVLHLITRNNRKITPVRLSLSLGQSEQNIPISLETSLLRGIEQQLNIELQSWPYQKDIDHGEAILTVKTANEDEYPIDFKLEIESAAFQEYEEDLLSDL